MKNVLNLMSCLVAMTFMMYLFAACNPKCDPVGSITISSDNNPAEYEILIRATPASSLLGKTISFGDVIVSDSAKTFRPNEGMVIKIPKNVSGSTKLKIQDLDCSDEVAFDFIVNSKEYYLKNPNFVSPIMPQIIFPTIATAYPSSINRAWVSPINTDYCLWFGQKSDSLLIDPATKKYKYIISLNGGSFEKTTCSNGLVNDPNSLHSLNPIYGYYDTTITPRKLFFTIDRTSRGAGMEEYVGEFIDIKATSYNKTSFPKTGNCTSDPDVKGSLLLVTSKKTGRQTLVFQSGVGP